MVERMRGGKRHTPVTNPSYILRIPMTLMIWKMREEKKERDLGGREGV